MNAPLALYVLAAVALLLLALALHARFRHRRFTAASRTWLTIVLIFGAVILWVLWQRGNFH